MLLSDQNYYRLRTFLRPYRGHIAKVTSHPVLRRLLTSNFGSGLIAFGEKNSYLRSLRWVTVDMEDADIAYDLRTHSRFPLSDGSQKIIYTSHMVEHVDPKSLGFFFREAHRILKEGGAMRIETPDCAFLYDSYLSGNWEVFERIARQGALPGEPLEKPWVILVGIVACYIENGVHELVQVSREQVEQKLRELSRDQFFDWCVSLLTPEQRGSGGHIQGLYPARLEGYLQEAGFAKIVHVKNGETQIPDLHLRGVERIDRAFYSFYVEAFK